MQCSSCGETMRDNEALCPACGADVDNTMPASEHALTPSPAAQKGTNVVLTVIGVLTVLALMVFVLLLGQQFGWFSQRQPAVAVHDLNDDDSITLPADAITHSDDDDLRRQLGLPFAPATFHTTANVHLRAQPDAQAESLGLLGIATQVRVLFYYSEDWFRVQYNDDVGYMAAEFLNTNLRVNIASPAVLSADRATLDRVFGHGAASAPTNNNDGTQTHRILYDGITVWVVTWRESGRDMFRVHRVDVRLDGDRRTRYHLHGVDNTSRRADILEILGGNTSDAWSGSLTWRDGDTTMRVNYHGGGGSANFISVAVDFADHHFNPPQRDYHYYW